MMLEANRLVKHTLTASIPCLPYHSKQNVCRYCGAQVFVKTCMTAEQASLMPLMRTEVQAYGACLVCRRLCVARPGAVFNSKSYRRRCSPCIYLSTDLTAIPLFLVVNGVGVLMVTGIF